MMAKAMAAYFTMQAGPNAIPEGNCDMTYEVVDGVETLYLSVFYAVSGLLISKPIKRSLT